MIGDGANDALAIKSADLGIVMWDGAPAVRRLASVVLTNNSFMALPDGVRLADNIIRYTEMFTSMFLNQTIIGLFFFIIVSVFNITFPLTPFNLTLMNYFTIGLPGMLVAYWIIRPRKTLLPSDDRPFLKKVVPFAFISAIFQTTGIVILFMIFVKYLHVIEINSLIVVAIVTISYPFFIFAPRVYQGEVDRIQLLQITLLGFVELMLLFLAFQIPFLTSFFNISKETMSLYNLIIIMIVVVPMYFIQYFIARYFHSNLNLAKKLSL
jgi:magnesium-transporting ATPase (P-type)